MLLTKSVKNAAIHKKIFEFNPGRFARVLTGVAAHWQCYQDQPNQPLGGYLDLEHIPCHRVVNSKGQLSRSYAFGGIEAQRRLLVSEGVVFKNEQVVDLSVSQMIFE